MKPPVFLEDETFKSSFSRLLCQPAFRLHSGDAILLETAEMHWQMGMDAWGAVPAAYGACGVGEVADV